MVPPLYLGEGCGAGISFCGSKVMEGKTEGCVKELEPLRSEPVKNDTDIGAPRFA